jgi:hypothetical protein
MPKAGDQDGQADQKNGWLLAVVAAGSPFMTRSVWQNLGILSVW